MPRSLRKRRDALAWGVRSGGKIFEHTHGGKDQWEYFQASARQEHQFSRAMASVEHLGATPMDTPLTEFLCCRNGAPLVDSKGLDKLLTGAPNYACHGLH